MILTVFLIFVLMIVFCLTLAIASNFKHNNLYILSFTSQDEDIKCHKILPIGIALSSLPVEEWVIVQMAQS
ncbi:hypothetical protein [Calothrix rhizosoleniae]|uniref:hypothetical protein n=1 Tax=Calothrix rhizosoleniae TaxID=888997 RepID=UPI000B4A3436|nr:hypothetical protein [Calothrix rhizosoleniae]